MLYHVINMRCVRVIVPVLSYLQVCFFFWFFLSRHKKGKCIYVQNERQRKKGESEWEVR